MKYPPIKSKVRFYTRTQSHIRSGLRLRCFGYDIIYKYDEWKFEFHFLEKIRKNQQKRYKAQTRGTARTRQVA